jgi:2-haloalkanoic acid dehalogenase type II
MGSLIKSVVFDAYGTIIDTKDGSVRATAAILQRNRVDLDPVEVYARWKRLHKLHIESLEEFVREEDIFLLDLKRLYEEYGISGNLQEDVKLMLATLGIRSVFPETLEVINALREQYRVYIASTTDEEPLVFDIKRNGICVDGYFTSQSLKVYKPRKEFFAQVLAAIGLAPKEMIYVGDSLRDDVYGPGQLNIRSVWINRKNYTLTVNDVVPDYQIHDLRELPPLLERINLVGD